MENEEENPQCLLSFSDSESNKILQKTPHKNALKLQ